MDCHFLLQGIFPIQGLNPSLSHCRQTFCHLSHQGSQDVLFIIRDWNAKVESQEIPGVTGKFGLGVHNEAGQRLTEFCQENTVVIGNTFFQQHKRRFYKWTSPDGQYQNRLTTFFATKHGETLYSQQKQNWELTVAQMMNSLLPNSDLN